MKYTALVVALLGLGIHSLSAAGNLIVVVSDKEGKPVPDAVVVVTPANKSILPKVSLAKEATINQERMQFIPAVTLLAPGAKIQLVNNDPWNHHVRSTPAGVEQFNTSKVGFEMMLEGKTEGKAAKPFEITLDKPGVVVANLLGCYIHGSMRGFVYVSESPWAVKTGANGSATFEDLPNGAAVVKIWQADQLIDVASQPTQIGASPVSVNFQLSVVPKRKRG